MKQTVKFHDFKYKLQIFKEILAYSWPFWATTSSHPPPARIHVRLLSGEAAAWGV